MLQFTGANRFSAAPMIEGAASFPEFSPRFISHVRTPAPGRFGDPPGFARAAAWHGTSETGDHQVARDYHLFDLAARQFERLLPSIERLDVPVE